MNDAKRHIPLGIALVLILMAILKLILTASLHLDKAPSLTGYLIYQGAAFGSLFCIIKGFQMKRATVVSAGIITFPFMVIWVFLYVSCPSS